MGEGVNQASLRIITLFAGASAELFQHKEQLAAFAEPRRQEPPIDADGQLLTTEKGTVRCGVIRIRDVLGRRTRLPRSPAGNGLLLQAGQVLPDAL